MAVFYIRRTPGRKIFIPRVGLLAGWEFVIILSNDDESGGNMD